MIRTIRSTFLLALIAVIAACGAPERTEGPAVEPQDDEPVTIPEQDQEREMMPGTLDEDIRTFQTNLEQALRQSEQELERASARIQGESPDVWQELSNRANTAWEEIRSDVEGLIAEDNGRELERSREEAAESLAELRGEVVQRELEASRDVRDFRQSVMQHLRSLESELDRLEQAPIMERERERERDPRMHENGQEQLRERIEEIRRDVEELDLMEEEQFRDRHEELAREVGELTKEVRQYRYEKEWTEQRQPY